MTDRMASPHFSGLTITLDHTLPAVIAHVAAVYGDRFFIVGEDGAAISFADFSRQVRQLAGALMAHGVMAGDRVAICAPNCPERIITACAIESIGAIMVPINTRFRGGEAGYVLAKTRARIRVASARFLTFRLARFIAA